MRLLPPTTSRLLPLLFLLHFSFFFFFLLLILLTTTIITTTITTTTTYTTITTTPSTISPHTIKMTTAPLNDVTTLSSTTVYLLLPIPLSLAVLNKHVSLVLFFYHKLYSCIPRFLFQFLFLFFCTIKNEIPSFGKPLVRYGFYSWIVSIFFY